MTPAQSATLRRLLGVDGPPPVAADVPRVTARLAGRAMLQDGPEFTCHTDEISVDEITIAADATPKLLQGVILYLDVIGGLNGVVTQTTRDGFLLKIDATAHKRAKLAEQITWLASNCATSGAVKARLSERIKPHRTDYWLVLEDGTRHEGEIIDVSRTGAAIKTAVSPSIRTRVLIGSTRAHVVRAFSGGLAVEFALLVPIERFGTTLVL
ncbi:MAG: type pilus assembly PilZ [Hyphomicrobiales bacterium]|nr:type pilus assembly PilZ [Hyphomicrobiales bacterium]